MGFFDRFRKKTEEETKTVKMEDYTLMEEYILVVDDAPFMRKVIRNELIKNGYNQIAEAEDGEKAVTAFKANRPYLVIMDLTMPHMDGIEACRAMGEIDPTVPVIICASPDISKAQDAAFDAGAKAFLGKPFVPEMLILAVKYALDDSPDTVPSAHSSVFITDPVLIETRKVIAKMKER